MQTMVNGAWGTGFNILTLSVFLLLTPSCKKENMGDCFKGTGKIIVESREITENYYKIELEDNVGLIITQGPVNSIQVEAGENIISLIETELINNVLTIRNKNRCNWVRSYNKPVLVHVTIPHLVSLQYKSAGNITSTSTLNIDSLNIEVWGGSGKVSLDVNCRVAVYAIHTGTGDLEIKGKTSLSYVWNSGNGFFYGSDLETNQTYIVHKGTGNCYVYSKNHLDAKVFHVGDVYYKGDPQIVTDIRGSGRLIKQD